MDESSGLDHDGAIAYLCKEMNKEALYLYSARDWRLPVTHRRVLDELVRRADRNGYVSVSYTTLARDLGLDAPRACRCVRRLEDAGYLVRERVVSSAGALLANAYRLKIPEQVETT